ncbi:MAG: NusG domain II-containing protein, partial [Spirochaetia bacterium]|nr:NusG domain II-containing protein [Spirochaetia bacterium]
LSVYGGPSSAMLSISVDGSEWLYPLSDDRVIEVPGLIGTTRIVIHDGTAHIEDSPCENKTCVASPPIKQTGEWAACLPNGVFIVIQGAESDELDATVR